jgi:NADH-quinone oxidoreductase subunit J
VTFVLAHGLGQALAVLAQAAPAEPGTPSAAGGTAEFWVFWILAPICLGSAVAMVLNRNAVHAALLLVVNFFTIAVFYAVLEAPFLAAVQIIVYAGAIMVLFLFVLMLLGVFRDVEVRPGIRIPGQRPAALLLGAILVTTIIGGVASDYLSAASVCARAPATEAVPGEPACRGLASANAEGNVEGVGELLFTDYVWPFEVTSVLLVITAVGAMVLGRKDEDPHDLVDHYTADVPEAARGRQRPAGEPRVATIGAGEPEGPR